MSKNKKLDHNLDIKEQLSRVMVNAGRTPLKVVLVSLRNYIILAIISLGFIYGISWIGIPAFGKLFQNFSPWSQQRQEIAIKNNVRDAYSAIIGSDVGMISQNGVVKWFSSKESKEIDIAIPKLINYSPLFDDDSKREELKDAFKDSINPEIMEQSTTYYRIFYDGSTLGSWKDGEELSTYKDLKISDKKAILKDLRLKLRTQKKIEFKEWQKKNKLETIDYDFESSTNTVKITGIFESDGFFWTTPEYNLSVNYKYIDGEWKIVKDTLKVKKT